MKRVIAIVAGGDSSEHDVSMRSAEGIYSFIDQEKYTLYIVELSHPARRQPCAGRQERFQFCRRRTEGKAGLCLHHHSRYSGRERYPSGVF